MSDTSGKFESKNFNAPEEVRSVDKGKIELVNVGGAMVGRATFDC
jgi:hypothetical protein